MYMYFKHSTQLRGFNLFINIFIHFVIFEKTKTDWKNPTVLLLSVILTLSTKKVYFHTEIYLYMNNSTVTSILKVTCSKSDSRSVR